jgi:LL-H family phage holin
MHETINLTPVIGAILVCIIFPLVATGVKYLSSKASEEKLAEISQYVHIAVTAAEQLYQSGQIKREERHEYVESVLKSKGIDVDLDEIEAMIESSVLYLPKLLSPVESVTAELSDIKNDDESTTSEEDTTE